MTTFRFTALCLLLTTASRGGDAKSALITPAPETSPWRVGAAYAPIFGLDVRFKGLGTYQSAYPVQPISAGAGYDYDDGFVHVDSSGNLGGQTWNWGYQNADQASENSVTMSLSSSTADARAREADEIAQGIDLFAYYTLGKLDLGGKEASWGLRGGLHYGHADVKNRGNLSTGTITVRDTYTLDPAGVMPGAPYSGSFGGPGPLLNDTPTRNFVNGSATVTGSRELDISMATLSFGPWIEIPVTEDFSVTLEAGLNAAIARGDYDFDSTTTILNVGTVQSRGSASDTKILPGVYVGASAIYELNQNWALQLSGRYQSMDRFSLNDGGSTATLNFDSAFILSGGVMYHF